MKKVLSVCPYCGVGCGLELQVDKGKIIGVLPQKNHPVSKGSLCIKGATLEKVINHPDRLKHPLINKNGKFEKVSWNKAIETIAKEFKRIKETYGSNAIGIFASKRATNEENYLLQKFARVVIGTNNIDNSTRLCHAPTIAGLYEILGRSAMTNSYEDLAESDCILIFGDNPVVSQPIAFNRIIECRKHGGKIVVVDVRRTETADAADYFVQISPNTDVVLAARLMKVILEEKLEDKSFISDRTKGYEEFLKSLEKFDMKKICEIAGVSEQEIRKVAKIYGKAEKAAIIFGMGITQQSNGMENVLALTDLALLTGNFGKPGSGVNPMRGCNNVQGTGDVGCLPDAYPGYSSVTEEGIKKFEKMWKVKNLPVAKGLTLTEMIEAVPERILAMYIIGQNPLVSLPSTNRVEKNLQNLEFLVVHDVFLTETAQLANVVLPAACFAEKTGTFTNSERRVQMIRKAADAPGQAPEDWQITKLLAEKMGYKKYFKFKSTEEIFKEIKKVVPSYSGITYKKLGDKGLQWPCDKKHPGGKKILFDKDFGPPGTRAVFYPISFIGPETLDHAYPFVLISHRILEHYNTGSMTRKVDVLNRTKPEAVVEISREDAKELKIKDGEKIKVSSPFGEILVKAKISDKVKKGVLGVPIHYTETRVNRLVGYILDPVSKIPAFKYCNVKVEKV